MDHVSRLNRIGVGTLPSKVWVPGLRVLNFTITVWQLAAIGIKFRRDQIRSLNTQVDSMSSSPEDLLCFREAFNHLSGNCFARIRTTHTLNDADAWTPWLGFDSFELKISRSITHLLRPLKDTVTLRGETSLCLTIARTLKTDDLKLQLPDVTPLCFFAFDLIYRESKSADLYAWSIISPIVHQTVVPHHSCGYEERLVLKVEDLDMHTHLKMGCQSVNESSLLSWEYPRRSGEARNCICRAGHWYWEGTHATKWTNNENVGLGWSK